MSDLMLDVGTANDLKMAFRRAGYSSADIKALCAGDKAAQILPVLRGHGTVQIVKHVINLAGDCMPESWKKDSWTIEKHVVGEGQLELDLSKIQLHLSSNQKDGKVIEGNKLRKELVKNKVPVLNACVLDYLIAHPEIIPEDWKEDEKGNTRYIYFWGTVYRFTIGRLCVRYLFWDGSVWCWDGRYLDGNWYVQNPAAILASVTQP